MLMNYGIVIGITVKKKSRGCQESIKQQHLAWEVRKSYFKAEWKLTQRQRGVGWRAFKQKKKNYKGHSVGERMPECSRSGWSPAEGRGT